jgi:putative membrane protein
MRYTKAVLALALGAFAMGAQAQAPTDPQIVGIVVAANQIDINASKLALAKSHNPQVRQFAQQMVDDHGAVQKSVFALGAKLHVTPADSSTQDALKKDAAENEAHLKTLSGAEFDRAYLDHEVAYHKQVIDAVKTTLIPNAKNAELKSALEGAAPMFQGHLEHAEHLQSSMGQ